MSYKKVEKNNFAGAWQNSEKNCKILKEENEKLKEEDKLSKEEIKRLKHKYNNLKKKYEMFMSDDIDEQIKLLQIKQKEQQKEKEQEQQKRKKIEDDHKKKLAEIEDDHKKKIQQEQKQYELLLQQEKIKMNDVVNEVVNVKPIEKVNEEDNSGNNFKSNINQLELFKSHNITKLYFKNRNINITNNGFILEGDNTIYKSLNSLSVGYFKSKGKPKCCCNVWINVYFEQNGKKILIQDIRN